MKRDRVSFEDRVARVVRQLASNKPVAKRDRGLQELFEQATGEPGTIDTASAPDAQFTVEPDATSRRERAG
jgi:hypothetical protein